MVETLQQKEQSEQQLWTKLWQKFGRQITPFFENPDGSVDKTKLNNKFKLKNSKIGADNNISLEKETNKLNQIIDEILDNPKISQKIKNEFAKQINEILGDFYSTTSLDITLLKRSREFLSFWLEDKTNWEILQIVLNWYIDRIGQMSSWIQRCSNDKTINIKWQEYHKASLDEFIWQIKELEKTTWFKLQDFVTDKIEKIDKEIFLSTSFWSQILWKNLISYLKQQRSTQENFETAYKGFESAYLKLYDSQITNYDQVKDYLKKWKINIPENMENKYATKLEDMKWEDLVIMLHSLIMAFIPWYAWTQDLMNLTSKYSVEWKKNTFIDKSFALAWLTAEASIVWWAWKKLLASPKAIAMVEKIIKLLAEGKWHHMLEKLMKTPKFQEIIKHPVLEWLFRQYWFDKKLALVNWGDFSRIWIAWEKFSAQQILKNYEGKMIGKIDKSTENLQNKLASLDLALEGLKEWKQKFFELVESIKPWTQKDTISRFTKEYLATWDRKKFSELISYLASSGKWADLSFEMADGSILAWRDLAKKLNWLSSQIHETKTIHSQHIERILWDINFARNSAQDLLLHWTTVENWLVQFQRFQTIFNKSQIVLNQQWQLQNELLMLQLFHKYMLANLPNIKWDAKLLWAYRQWLSQLLKDIEQLTANNSLKKADTVKINIIRQELVWLGLKL